VADINLEKVWKDFSERKIDAVAQTLGMTNEQALQAVGKEVVNASEKFLGGIWRYSFDVLVFAFLVSLLLVFVFVARQSFPHGKSQQVVLTAAGGIPKYHVITDKDVELQTVKTIDGSLGDVGKVLAHYTMEPIVQGATIRSSQLSSGMVAASALQGQQVFLLPIKGISYQAKDMPVKVSLYLSPKTVSDKQVMKPIVIRGAYLLSSGGDANSGWAVIALTADDANAIAGVLGSSELHLSENLP
jgi:hypothetical protein